MSIDPRTLRQTVGRFVTGVTVIAMEVEGEIRAMTANSFTSLSLDPPLVLFCLGKDTKAGLMIHGSPGFAVSILSQTQRDLSSYFAGLWRDSEPPPFTFVAWDGGPRLEGDDIEIAPIAGLASREAIAVEVRERDGERRGRHALGFDDRQ